MSQLNVTIHSSPKQPKKIRVEMDAEKLEKLAASLGLFNPSFVNSIDEAEKDYKKGGIKKIKSLKDLRK